MCTSVSIHKSNLSPSSLFEMEVGVQYSYFLLGSSSVSRVFKYEMVEGASKSEVLTWTHIFELHFLEHNKEKLG